MKKITYLILSVVAFLVVTPAIAQNRFGADSAECVKYLSFYRQYMQQGNLKDAAPLWRKAIAICPPQANQNMLLDGMKILRKEISQYANNPIRREQLVDSIVMLHNMRMEAYPKYMVQARVNLATDMINYCKDKPEEVFSVLAAAMDVAKAKVPVVVPVKYLDIAINLYADGKKTADDVMAAYQKSAANLNEIEAAKPSEAVTSAKADLDNLFSQSGVASCENLVALYQPRYDAEPNNKELLASIVSFFNTQNCLEEPLFRNAVESLHKLEPSFSSAYFLFKLYSNSGDNEKAISYMNEAIAYPESDNLKDAEYNFELATFFYKKEGKLVDAVRCAKAAAELDASFAGKAYFLIGTIWGSMKCDGNDIEVRAPYWVAVDYLEKARNADPTLDTEDTRSLISSYKKYYPMQADAFMFDVLDGASYTVSCGGMRETTKVRTQK